ncbi:MAG TPA: glycosyltransferase [Tepidisphaeraceae bacterium]|jgi:glycosyltransferase involved in cell wall biosynthesis
MLSAAPNPKRIDLHCHSDASNKTSEAVLNALRCPESYSRPDQVYAQARLRGMDFVTLTDHDSIEGALQIAHRPDVLVGEELTCWFPEDGCKMHVLVYGISQEDHDALQSRARNIYDVAEYIESHNVAHAVAHPIYRQNDKLERWHLERLILLFKGFECLNGAHSSLHREAFEPLLNALDEREISRLSETHGIGPRWPEPWAKARIGGSDDHGLLNVGRTWTEFPPDAKSTEDVLRYLREGVCMPGGEAGSSAKLAHTFYSVAVRYYARHIMSPRQKPNIATTLLQALAGEGKPPSKGALAVMGAKHKLKKLMRKAVRPLGIVKPEPVAGTSLLKKLFLQSAWEQFKQHPEIRQTLESGLPALGEHDRMFELVSQVNRKVTDGLAAAINRSVDDASFVGLFDTIGAILAQQFVLLPYYFAVFHQNKERHLLREITRLQTPKRLDTLRIGLFTDTFDEVNGVSRFLRDMSQEARRLGRRLVVHTCSDHPDARNADPMRRNFCPLLSRPLPYYEQLRLNLPPLLDILEWSDRQQFDLVHVSTPGPMGLCGWAVSKMLRVPMLATYHTDFPAYAEKLAGDHRITNGTIEYMKWFYGQASAVFTRSSAYRFNLRDLDVPEEKLRTIPAGVDLDRFSSIRLDDGHWERRGVREARRLLYVGRVSVEKNLPMLVEAFRMLSSRRRDCALIVVGDGPYVDQMKRELQQLPVYFFQTSDDAVLREFYSGSDVLVFPSRTDTLGQVVMEAQACGLPAIVTNEGGPKESVEHNVTGVVLGSSEPAAWCDAIETLLDDTPRRQRMSRAAAARMTRFSLDRTCDAFWAEHLAVCERQPSASEAAPIAPAITAL